MGCAVSAEDKAAMEKNNSINNAMKAEKDKQRNEVKLLLLGAGESGKSTVVKQMKIIHSNGFKKDERDKFKGVIYGNIISSMQSILNALPHLGISLPAGSPLASSSASVLALSEEELENAELGDKLMDSIKILWESPEIQKAFTRASEYQLNDSAKYYFDNLERIGAREYVPTEHDVLRSRVKTTGIIETEFNYKDLHFRMFDVGGQRSERKKWIHCFENVTAIIFCVALSGYDLSLQEDETQNRMGEALKLFESICNSKWFESTSIILFLNKTDLFREKIKVAPLKLAFPEYKGANTFSEASEFIKQSFHSLNKNPEKQIYSQFTCATDTENVKFVFNSVTDIIIQNNLRDSGLL